MVDFAWIPLVIDAVLGAFLMIDDDQGICPERA